VSLEAAAVAVRVSVDSIDIVGAWNGWPGHGFPPSPMLPMDQPWKSMMDTDAAVARCDDAVPEPVEERLVELLRLNLGFPSRRRARPVRRTGAASRRAPLPAATAPAPGSTSGRSSAPSTGHIQVTV
jgi:hypothetical protein